MTRGRQRGRWISEEIAQEDQRGRATSPTSNIQYTCTLGDDRTAHRALLLCGSRVQILHPLGEVEVDDDTD